MERCEGIDAFFQCSHRRRVRVARARRRSRRPLRSATATAPPGWPDVLHQQDRGRGVGAAHRDAGSDIPTVIARLSVPYGDTFGWPMFQRDDDRARHGHRRAPDAPSHYSPLHLDDIVASLPYLLASASVPATIVNWGGDEIVGVEDVVPRSSVSSIGKDVGASRPTSAAPSRRSRSTSPASTTSASTRRVAWQDGIRRWSRPCDRSSSISTGRSERAIP